jgi:hypothetical protein
MQEGIVCIVWIEFCNLAFSLLLETFRTSIPAAYTALHSAIITRIATQAVSRSSVLPRLGFTKLCLFLEYDDDMEIRAASFIF